MIRLKELKGLPLQYRTMTIKVGDILPDGERADGDDRIPISISSEEPVGRWFGNEILSHDTNAVDLAHARDGLPFLDNHDTGKLRGLIEDVRVKDGKLHGMVKLSRSPDAASVRQDILDGIRKNISVGYRINEMKLEQQSEDDADTYRVTDWTPMEGSTVTVPADITVGVGRSVDDSAVGPLFPVRLLDGEDDTTTEGHEGGRKGDTMSDKQDTAVPSAAEVRNLERERVITLNTLADNFDAPADMRSRWIASDTTPEQAKSELLDRQGKYAPPAPVDHAGAILDEGPQAREYSLVRALRATTTGDWKDAGYEREISNTLAKEFSKDMGPMSFVVPTYKGMRVTGQLDTGTSAQGQQLVFDEPGSFIELLRSKMFVMAAGAQFLGGLRDSVSWPRQSGAGTFSWVTEGPTAGLAVTNLTTDLLQAVPNNGQSTTQISRQLLGQSTIGAEQLIRNDMAAIHARAIDAAAINGSGSGQPTGILNITGIGDVAGGANGLLPTYLHMVALETDIAAADADAGSMAYMSTPGVRGALKGVQTFSGTDGSPVWTGGIAGGEVNGYRAFATNQIPSNLTKGTSTTVAHAVIFGNWNDLIFCEWGAMVVIVDPYTLAARNLIAVTSHQMIDVAVRHPASFSAMQDALLA